MHTREKGNIGEGIACKFLKNKGFVVIDRNYAKKWGELDIVAQKDKKIHFFEVKAMVVGSLNRISAISAGHTPEENVHAFKIRQIRKMVQTYLADKKIGPGAEFQFHVLSVYMNEKTRRARVKWLKDVIL